jgi:quercetin dioxygenase-like cupin family protein
MFKLLLPLFLMACAHQNRVQNNPMVVDKAQGYMSPNQLVEADMLIHNKKDFKAEIYVGKGVLKPGAVVPQHIHADSDEILVFSQGGGELIVDGKVHKVREGQTYFIPRGVKHSYSNRSKFTAKFVQIYNPSGPEKKFLQWAPK